MKELTPSPSFSTFFPPFLLFFPIGDRFLFPQSAQDSAWVENIDNSIKGNDIQLGRLLAALEANSTNALTVVDVLSDYGFGCPKPTSHGCSPNTFITSNDINLTGGLFMKDVAGFLLSNFGLLPSPVCQ